MPLQRGVHNVAATPFLPDETLDLASLRSLVDACLDAGCAGMLILGVLGEADKLADAERDAVVAGVIEAAAGRLQVTVGVTHGATVVTRQRAVAAARMGADAVMISPPPGSAAGVPLRDHFLRVADALPPGMTVVVQDHPTSSGVKLPVDFLAALGEALPAGSVVKLEDPPTAAKMAALRAATGAFQTFGGLGGVSLLPELDAGADGTMTGFALADVLVQIVAAYQAGNRQQARRLYEAALPLMVIEAQPGAGVAPRKALLARRGALAHPTVRQPAPTLDAFSLTAWERAVAETAAAIAAVGGGVVGGQRRW